MSSKAKTVPPGCQRVLVIDDEKDVAYSFQRVLAEEPVEVIGATSGEEGFKLLKKHPIDLILLDVRIGEPHEGALLAQARRDGPRASVEPQVGSNHVCLS